MVRTAAVLALVVLSFVPAHAGTSGGLGGGPGAVVHDTTTRYVRPAQGPDVPVNGLESGLTLGTPAGLNLSEAVWAGRWAVRASGGWSGKHTWGVQGSLLRCVSAARRRHSVGLTLGEAKLEEKDWHYGGVAYELRGRWWLFEGGLSAGHGHGFTNPQATVQFGFAYR